MSDGLGCFVAAESAGVHQHVVTGGGKASTKLPQFQAVNTVLSNLKAALSGRLVAVAAITEPHGCAVIREAEAHC